MNRRMANKYSERRFGTKTHEADQMNRNECILFRFLQERDDKKGRFPSVLSLSSQREALLKPNRNRWALASKRFVRLCSELRLLSFKTDARNQPQNIPLINISN